MVKNLRQSLLNRMLNMGDFRSYFQLAYIILIISKSSGRGSISEKQDKKQEKKANVGREDDQQAIGTDTLDDSAKKEKFKMAIGKPKKDLQDEPAKPVQKQIGVTVDANAAAAILQAARRGIKNLNLGILSSNPLNDTSQFLGSSSYPSSSLTENIGQANEQLVSGPTANALTKKGALAADSEADSSEVGLTKEQKLKAERLKRAKMFVAMIKGGADPLKSEPTRSLSVELSDSGVSGSGTNDVEPAGKEREGSLALSGAAKKLRGGDFSERWSKRKYRSRSGKNEDDEKEEGEDGEELKDEKKRSRRKRHSDLSRDRHKHKRRRSSKEGGPQSRHKHDLSSDDEHHKRLHHRHKHSKFFYNHDHDTSDKEHHHRHRSSKPNCVDSSDDNEHGHRHRPRSIEAERESSNV